MNDVGQDRFAVVPQTIKRHRTYNVIFQDYTQIIPELNAAKIWVQLWRIFLILRVKYCDYAKNDYPGFHSITLIFFYICNVEIFFTKYS